MRLHDLVWSIVILTRTLRTQVAEEGWKSVVQKIWKYLSKHLQFAKEVRIYAPPQIATLFVAIEDFPRVFPSDQCQAIVDSGEWRLFRENVVMGVCRAGCP